MVESISRICYYLAEILSDNSASVAVEYSLAVAILSIPALYFFSYANANAYNQISNTNSAIESFSESYGFDGTYTYVPGWLVAN